MKMTKNEVLEYVQNQYGTQPDFPWFFDDVSMVLRHAHHRKWYGLLTRVKREKLGLSGDGEVDILNLKTGVSASEVDVKMGILPAWHMNKKHWITVVLSGGLTSERICQLIDESYELTFGKK